MTEFDDLKKICYVNGNEKNYFVGLKFENNSPKIYFPNGFDLSNDLKNLRKDIRLLINILSSFIYKKGFLTATKNYSSKYDKEALIQSYFDVIDYFIKNNYKYYFEIEKRYKTDTKGKINRKKTIEKQNAFIKNNHPIYLNFVTENKTILDYQLISKIHEYCVYHANQQIGWCYSLFEFPKPSLTINDNNKKSFISILDKKIENTHIEKDKTLFMAMKSILENNDNKILKNNINYGTYEFHVIWEKMIDNMFGIKDKYKYFPRGHWLEKFLPINESDKNALIPDSIMMLKDNEGNNKIYVLDSKYYKYGVTKSLSDLPNSSDISKQITYGESIKNKNFKGNKFLFNAFILPFNSNNNKFQIGKRFLNVAEAQGDWRKKDNEALEYFERVQGILVDIKYVMLNYQNSNDIDKRELASCIEEFIDQE